MVTCFWHRGPPPGNLGDVLSPVILRGLGIDVGWAPKVHADLLACGSVVGAAQPGTMVWGSGAMSQETCPDPAARYLAVRGPMTRDLVRSYGGDCPEVYGDPALLLPEIHDRPVEKRHEVGVVEHYVDEGRAPDIFPTISPVSADPLHVVDRIRSCERIASSSLHGLVVAQAYGIPWAWVRFSGSLNGDDTKFDDFAASVGVDAVPYPSVEDAEYVLGQIDPRPLLDALEPLR